MYGTKFFLPLGIDSLFETSFVNVHVTESANSFAKSGTIFFSIVLWAHLLAVIGNRKLS